MSGAALQDRLREHAAAFDGLLSLIPAKLYYGNGDEPSEQWRRKKQTKEERKAARRANLDPENELNKSVKELIEERAARNKRKLQEVDDEDEVDEEDSDSGILKGVVKEKPKEGLKASKVPRVKMADKATLLSGSSEGEVTGGKSIDEKEEQEEKKGKEEGYAEDLGLSLKEMNMSQRRAEKLLKKQQKAERKAEKRKLKKAGKMHDDKPTEQGLDEEEAMQEKKSGKGKEKDETDSAGVEEDEEEDEDEDEEEDDSPGAEIEPGINFSMLGSTEGTSDGEDSSPSLAASSTFDTAPAVETRETASITTSVSSMAPSEGADRTERATKHHIKIPSDTSALRVRLAARIEALRAARKADGPDGKPIRTRQELIEARRQKQTERKQHKKLLRQQAREEEERKREEAVASARASPLVRVGSGMGSGSPVTETPNFSFGRVAFADGTQLSRDLTFAKGDESGGLVGATTKRKGPAASDVRGQLARLESQKNRLASMDEETRREVEEKERWLAARRRAAAAVDDSVMGGGLTAGAAAAGAASTDLGHTEMLLKKAIKRKEKSKKKSEREWADRKEGVERTIQERQRKREENLRKRREDKMLHRSGLAKKKKKGGANTAGKGKGRPGFEGSFGRK